MPPCGRTAPKARRPPRGGAGKDQWCCWQTARNPGRLALWLGLKVSGCGHQGVPRPDALAVWLGGKD